MDNALIFDEKTLKRIPPIFTLLFILLLGFPAVALHYFGIDFSNATKDINNDYNLGVFFGETQIRSYFIQILLQWSAFTLSAITTLLAFTQYRLTNDKVALIIGLAILCSGSVDALHTLMIEGLSPYIRGNENIDFIIWTFINSVSGIIYIIGLLVLLKDNYKKTIQSSMLSLFLFIIVLTAIVVVYYTAFIIKKPSIWIEDAWFPKSYELLYLLIYLFIIFFIYPRVYKKYPGILTNCIFYMSATQIIIAVYLYYFLNTSVKDVYNIAYLLKIFTYFVPFSCLIINYVFSYNRPLSKLHHFSSML